MTTLLDAAPYAPRDDARFLADADALTRSHLAGCAAYRAIWPDYPADPAATDAEAKT